MSFRGAEKFYVTSFIFSKCLCVKSLRLGFSYSIFVASIRANVPSRARGRTSGSSLSFLASVSVSIPVFVSTFVLLAAQFITSRLTSFPQSRSLPWTSCSIEL